MNSSRIAVLGAGVAGVTAAKRLQELGYSVEVFEQEPQVGGRCCDHGTQFFTARHASFAEAIRCLVQGGWVGSWEGRTGILGENGFHFVRPSVARWVGIPTMRSLVEGLHQGLKLHLSTPVHSLERLEGGWTVHSERAFPGFAAVLVTMPAPQAGLLMQPHAPVLSEWLATIHYDPCLVAQVDLRGPSGLDYAAASVKDLQDGLGFVVRHCSKPHRELTAQAECWMLHSTASWARQHEKESPLDLAGQLLQAFCRRTGVSPDLVEKLQGHRWNHARVNKALGRPCLWSGASSLGWAGDGALGVRLESAFLSGLAAASTLHGSL